MNIRLALGLAFAAIATVVHAESCLSPLEYETPRSELELRQSGRLASEIISYPGFPWLVVSATNRYPLHTIRGDRFEELRAEWPRSGLWHYRDAVVRPDGTVLGFGRNPNRVYQLAPGEQIFSAVELPEYSHATYEPHRDVVLLLTRDGALLEWDGSRVQQSHLTGTGSGQNTVLPRFIPELDLWLSTVDDTLFSRRSGKNQEWSEVGGVAEKWSFRLAEAQYHVNEGERLLSFVLGGIAYSYHVPEEGLPSLVYQIEGQFPYLWSHGEPGLILRQHRAVKRGTFGKFLGRRDIEAWREPLIFMPEEFESAANLPVSKTPSADAIQLPKEEPYRLGGANIRYTPPLFDLPDGRYFYDGTSRVLVPHLSEERVGKFVRWFNWQSRVWVLTETGWHEFMPDLKLRVIASPFDDARVYDLDVIASDRLGGLVFAGERGAVQGGMWVTRDGETFENLIPIGSSARRYLSDIPDRPASLVLGEDGLYLLNETCEGD